MKRAKLTHKAEQRKAYTSKAAQARWEQQRLRSND
jgi:hypothetical protein